MEALIKILELIINKIRLNVLAFVCLALWVFPHLTPDWLQDSLGLRDFYSQHNSLISGSGLIAVFYLVAISFLSLYALVRERYLIPRQQQNEQHERYNHFSNEEKQILRLFFQKHTSKLALKPTNPSVYTLTCQGFIIDHGDNYNDFTLQTHIYFISNQTLQYIRIHPECLN